MLRLEDIQTLQKQNGDALVSILAPTEPVFPASDKNRILIKNLIRDAEERLKANFDPVHADNLIAKLKELEAQVDYEHTNEGVGMFVSGQFSRLFYLPYTPTQIISIGRTFHTRDLMTAYYKNPRYLLLSLSAEHVRLYRGFGKALKEIKNEHFPASYAGPARTEPLSKITRQDTEYEVLEDVRIFLRAVDENLFEIADSDKTPIYLVGESEWVSFIMNQGKSGKYVAANIKGNYVHNDWRELLDKVYPVVQQIQEKEIASHMNNLQEMIGYNRYAKGISDVWKAMKLGQVLTLYVENGYMVPANVKTDNELELILHTEGTPGLATHFDDVVDEIMEQVVARDGKVIVTEDGHLNQHGHIAAVLRYAV